jgi:hypothetical protein
MYLLVRQLVVLPQQLVVLRVRERQQVVQRRQVVQRVRERWWVAQRVCPQ